MIYNIVPSYLILLKTSYILVVRVLTLRPSLLISLIVSGGMQVAVSLL